MMTEVQPVAPEPDTHRTRMFWFLIGAVLVIALAIAIAVSVQGSSAKPAAHTPTSLITSDDSAESDCGPGTSCYAEQAYIDGINNNSDGQFDDVSITDLINDGNWLCGQLDLGYTLPEMMSRAVDAGWDQADYDVIIRASTQNLCANYSYMLDQYYGD